MKRNLTKKEAAVVEKILKDVPPAMEKEFKSEPVWASAHEIYLILSTEELETVRALLKAGQK